MDRGAAFNLADGRLHGFLLVTSRGSISNDRLPASGSRVMVP